MRKIIIMNQSVVLQFIIGEGFCFQLSVSTGKRTNKDIKERKYKERK